jgi:hypothetical protein
MAIRVDISGTDAILTITSQELVPGFIGYEIERRLEDGAWLPWNGSAWGGPVALVSRNRFSDYALSGGIYQYRARAALEVAPPVRIYTDWEDSDWVRIASPVVGNVGWTFGNYVPITGEFGAVLTPDDLRYTYLWGVPFTSSNGQEYTDAQIAFSVDAAVREFELALGLTIKKKVIRCRENLAPGAVYDELEDPYGYKRRNWNAGGHLQTRRRPILSVERLELYTITQQRVLDLHPWLRVDHEKGVLHFYPRAGTANTMRVSPSFMAFGYHLAGDYAHGYQLDYTAGFENAAAVPAELREIIGKAAACRLLNIIGDGLIAGFSSMSLSMDGLSESFSTTQSATNAFFGARIGVYLKDIENFLKENRYKYRGRFMGSI